MELKFKPGRHWGFKPLAPFCIEWRPKKPTVQCCVCQSPILDHVPTQEHARFPSCDRVECRRLARRLQDANPNHKRQAAIKLRQMGMEG